MLNLLNLHWIANRRLLLQIAPLFALWLFLGLRGLRGEVPQEGFFATICLMMATTLMAIVTLQGITHGVEPFLLALPLRRGGLVASAYLAGLLAGLVGLSLPLLVTLALPGLALPAGLAGVLALLYGFLGLGLFLLLPLRFILGGERGLTAFALLLGAVLLVTQLSLGLAPALIRLAEFGARILAHPLALGLPLAFAWVALGLLSAWVACRGYGQRSF